MKKTVEKTIYFYLLFVVYAALLLFFCTKSSPLYVFNDYYDPNAHFTMGKGLMQGAVPYRDLFDHKGPFLYLLFGIGYLIDHTGFIGIYLIEILSMSLVLIFAYKTALIYTERPAVSCIIALLVPIAMLSSGIFVTGADLGGGSADEFIAPLFMIALYLVIRTFRGKEQITGGQGTMFLLGIIGGLILMIKFNQFAMIVGLLAPLLIMLMFRQFKVFLQFAGCLAAGCIVSLLPYLIYALATDSLRDFFEVYIRFNLVYGTSGTGNNLLHSLSAGLKGAIDILIHNFLIYTVVILFGLLYFIYKRRQDFVLNFSILLGFALTAVAVCIQFFGYVLIPAMVFTLFGYLAAYDLFRSLRMSSSPGRTSPNRAMISAFTVLFLFIFTVGNNGLIAQKINRATSSSNPIPCQQQVAEIIARDGEENPTLLQVLFLDTGFYTAAEIVPTSRYFYLPNVSYQNYSDVFKGQYEDIAAGLNTYLVTTYEAKRNSTLDNVPMTAENYTAKFQNITAQNYELDAVIKGTYNQEGITYYLYHIKEA